MKYLAILFLISCTPLTLKKIPECTHLGDELICTFPSGFTPPNKCVQKGKEWLCDNDSVMGYQCTSPNGKLSIEREINAYLSELEKFRAKCGTPSGCKKR
jgi:hypothetical protein